MAYQSVFKRYELKYLLAKGQKEKVPEAMVPYMERDKYGGTTIGISYAGTYVNPLAYIC